MLCKKLLESGLYWRQQRKQQATLLQQRIVVPLHGGKRGRAGSGAEKIPGSPAMGGTSLKTRMTRWFQFVAIFPDSSRFCVLFCYSQPVLLVRRLLRSALIAWIASSKRLDKIEVDRARPNHLCSFDAIF